MCTERPVDGVPTHLPSLPDSITNASRTSQVILSFEQDCSPSMCSPLKLLKLLQTDCGGPVICHSDSGLIDPRNTLLQGKGYLVNHAMPRAQFTNLCIRYMPYIYSFFSSISSASVGLKELLRWCFLPALLSLCETQGSTFTTFCSTLSPTETSRCFR